MRAWWTILINTRTGMRNTNKIKKTVSTDTSLHNLEKFTNYSVRIAAYTTIGDGVKSLPIYCHTAEDCKMSISLYHAIITHTYPLCTKIVQFFSARRAVWHKSVSNDLRQYSGGLEPTNENERRHRQILRLHRVLRQGKYELCRSYSFFYDGSKNACFSKAVGIP